MLTFFEYLRQRAFESVLSGAQEALEFLESQKALKEPKKAIPQLAQRSTDDPSPSTTRKAEVKSDIAPTQSDHEPLPSPRHRGRPTNQSKGKK